MIIKDRKELEINTLFKENRIITLNIVSNSVPQKVKDIIMDTKTPDDLKILIKLDRQTSAFKKTKFYEYLLKSHSDLYDHLIDYNNNSGKGYAVKKGLEASTGDYIIFQDADLEYDPKDFSKFIDLIDFFKKNII